MFLRVIAWKIQFTRSQNGGSWKGESILKPLHKISQVEINFISSDAENLRNRFTGALFPENDYVVVQ
jgi:hypothetical protein